MILVEKDHPWQHGCSHIMESLKFISIISTWIFPIEDHTFIDMLNWSCSYLFQAAFLKSINCFVLLNLVQIMVNAYVNVGVHNGPFMGWDVFF